MIQISKNSKCITMKGKNCLQCSLGAVTSSQGMKLNKRKCRLPIYKVFPTAVPIKSWNGLSVEILEKPSCKSFHTRVDKVFKDTPLERNPPDHCGGRCNEWPTQASHLCFYKCYVPVVERLSSIANIFLSSFRFMLVISISSIFLRDL